MPFLGNILFPRKNKGSTPESSGSSVFDKRKSFQLPPHNRIHRTKSVASFASLGFFRTKNPSHNDLDFTEDQENAPDTKESRDRRRSQYTLNSQSMSATNGLAALRISTPTDFRSAAGQSVITEHDESYEILSPQSILSPVFSSSPTSSSPESSPAVNTSKPAFLSLPTSEVSFDLQVNIDFAEFEQPRAKPAPKQEESPKRIKDQDFLFLIDDGPGIDRRQWDTMADIVHGVAKRLNPRAARDASTFTELTPECPNISIRFVNSHRHLPKLSNLNQIYNIFNWVTPRDSAKYYSNRSSHIVKPTTHIPPLRVLDYYFWNHYNEKLQRNLWVGQNPTTMLVFVSSPLGTRPEDMDLFIAKSAERLNDDQVPLPLISIMVVQCNADPTLHRQLADTRRMISWEWYTPRPKLQARTAARKGGTRELNPEVPQPRKRPQRDWVDIITCVDWERAGGISGIKALVEDEIIKGTHRRKKAQRDVAMDYLTHLGKEPTAQETPTIQEEGQEELGVAYTGRIDYYD